MFSQLSTITRPSYSDLQRQVSAVIEVLSKYSDGRVLPLSGVVGLNRRALFDLWRSLRRRFSDLISTCKGA